MIFGIGHDIVSNQRIQLLLGRFGERLINKILSAEEKIVIQGLHCNQEFYLAKRFAAKEAFAKACGTGITTPILFTSISVLNDSQGKPYLKFNLAIESWLKQYQITRQHISISDERDFSSAFVVLEK